MVEEAREMRALLQRAANMLRNRCVMLTFGAWREAVEETGNSWQRRS